MLPRGRHQRVRRGVRTRRQQAAVHPDPARGDGSVRSHRLRQVLRWGRRCAWRRPGPGAIHLLNGLYDAKLDHVPVVAIVGQTARSAMGGAYQQEVDLKALFKDVASDYLVEVNVAKPTAERVGSRDPHRWRAGPRRP